MKRNIIIAAFSIILTISLASPAFAQDNPLPNPPFDQEKCLDMGAKGAPFAWDGDILTGKCTVSPSRR